MNSASSSVPTGRSSRRSSCQIHFGPATRNSLPGCNQSANHLDVDDPHCRRQGTSASIDRQSKSQSEATPRIAPTDVSCLLFVDTARWLSSTFFFCVGLISSLSYQSIHHSPHDGSNYLSALTSLLIRRLLIRLVDCGPLLSSGYIRDVDLHTDWMFASRVNAHRPTKSIRGNGNNLRAH